MEIQVPKNSQSEQGSVSVDHFPTSPEILPFFHEKILYASLRLLLPVT